MSSQLWQDLKGWGPMPAALVLLIPRLAIGYVVVGAAMIARGIARLFGAASSYEPKANLRILIVTDYMPPQTHGIAFRFRQYVDFMRRDGHEVHVFCTSSVREVETSFDHPNLPCICNPYNMKNKMAYNAGVKLAWYLSAKQWDLVHIVCPSNICWAILPVTAWRRIPCYVSHHVDMEYYIYEYVKARALANFGWCMYWLITKLPCKLLAQCNAAPTLTFLDQHICKEEGYLQGARHRIPSGVADERFTLDSDDPDKQRAAERGALLERCGLARAGEEPACVLLMVQRLAPEKGTMHALEALAALQGGGAVGRGSTASGKLSLDGTRRVHLLVCGDGPSMKSLQQYAEKHQLPVSFLGNVPNTQLPPLYRAADVFVTCSTSETYGLTVLEALACGTPAVLPHCGVFDELWASATATWRVPDRWIYDEGNVEGLLHAMRDAASPAAKARLQREPVKASWRDATNELVRQYKEIINSNLPNRQVRATIMGALDSLLRAILGTLCAYWVVRSYTKRSFKIGVYLLDNYVLEYL